MIAINANKFKSISVIDSWLAELRASFSFYTVAGSFTSKY